uniref:Putative secreted peptide n=1 Tax=Anopheles braziliensis TaxID=58242 RepID=A0A2M3ZWX1_9DIPT
MRVATVLIPCTAHLSLCKCSNVHSSFPPPYVRLFRNRSAPHERFENNTIGCVKMNTLCINHPHLAKRK